MKIFYTSLFFVLASQVTAVCVKPHEYFPMEGDWVPRNSDGSVSLGMYSRVSPDGRYFLRSFSGVGLSTVSLIELIKNESGNSTRGFSTPLDNEAFPANGTWRYLISTGGGHYNFKDVIASQKKAKKQFTGGQAGFYAIAAEIPGGNSKEHKLRSIAWPTGSDTAGVGYLSNKVITVKSNNGSASKIDSTGASLCSNLSKTEGTIYSLPMISPNAYEFSAMPQSPKDDEPSLRIYRVLENNKDCEKIDDLKTIVGKVTFSYGGENSILFNGGTGISNRGNGVHFYNRTFKKAFTLSDPNKTVYADSFPGFTRDGRIVYGATWKDCDESGKCVEKAGYVVSDPYQSEDFTDFKKENPDLVVGMKECINEEDVQREREYQEKIWNYQQE